MWSWLFFILPSDVLSRGPDAHDQSTAEGFRQSLPSSSEVEDPGHRAHRRRQTVCDGPHTIHEPDTLHSLHRKATSSLLSDSKKNCMCVGWGRGRQHLVYSLIVKNCMCVGWGRGRQHLVYSLIVKKNCMCEGWGRGRQHLVYSLIVKNSMCVGWGRGRQHLVYSLIVKKLYVWRVR